MRVAIRTALLILAVVATTIGLSWAQAYHEKTRAQALLALFEGIQVGEDSDTSFSWLKKNFGSFMDLGQSLGEDDSKYGHIFTFRNRALWRLHLAPLRAVNIGLGYKSGRIISKFVEFVEYDRCAIMVEDFGA
jgi:hypothetical protein